MSATKNDPQEMDYGNLANFGYTPILAALIIGGALVAGAVMMWQTHNQKVQLMEMSRIEEQARVELRGAYMELRSLRPETALEKTGRADMLIQSLNAKLAPDYAPLKVSLLLVEAESLFMKDCAAHADLAEEKFDKALSLMSYASGELWQFGMLGRARARFEQGKFAEALGDLSSVLNRNPSFGAAYYWRALTREQLNETAAAKEDENKARALDSWPPLRDYMQAACIWTRDIIHKPKPCDTDPDSTECQTADMVEAKSLAPFFVPEPEEIRTAGEDGKL